MRSSSTKARGHVRGGHLSFLLTASDPKPEDAEEWRELDTRWFQYGTFLPFSFEPRADRTVRYDGAAVEVEVGRRSRWRRAAPH